MQDVTYPLVLVTSILEGARITVRIDPSGIADETITVPEQFVPAIVEMLQQHVERRKQERLQEQQRQLDRFQGRQAQRTRLLALLANPQADPEQIDHTYVNCLFEELAPFLHRSYESGGRGALLFDFTKFDLQTVSKDELFSGRAVATNYLLEAQINKFNFDTLSHAVMNYDPQAEFVVISLHNSGPKIYYFKLIK